MYAYKLYKSGRFSENPSQIGSGILLSKDDNSEINNEDQKDTRIVHYLKYPQVKITLDVMLQSLLEERNVLLFV